MQLDPAGVTLRNERRDFVEWHRGRRPYVLWALDLAAPEVARRVACARDPLADLLLAGYCRQPHVTLELCGFAGSPPLADDEFAPDYLAAQFAALAGAAPAPFAIAIGGLASFSSAPYLTVRDPAQGIAALRRCLAVDGENRLNYDYVPHVTVGLYGDAWPVAEVLARLAASPAEPPVWCLVERVSLMSYEPSEIGGRLTCLASHSLGAGG